MAKKIKKEQKRQDNEIEDITQIINFDKINWVYVVIALVVIALIAGAYYGLKNSREINNFFYNGVPFNKTIENNVVFYTVKVPFMDDKGRPAVIRSIDFRSDPRKLTNIEFEKTGNIHLFTSNKSITVTYGDLKICPENAVAAANLGLFFNKVGINTKVGLMNKTAANESRLDYVTCGNKPTMTVIEVMNGDKTMIKQTAANCYQIISDGCDIVEAVEKFQLQVLEEYFARI